ncbi:MAG: hypothetical protein ILP04_03925 [Bacteroidales bacterium]|nr:hypothetical protein [Bacteroidales bacterium]
MKTKALFLSVLMTGLFLNPAWALITDPEDYVVYDSGQLCERGSFSKPDFFSATGWEFGEAAPSLSGNSSMAEFLGASSTTDPLNAILIGKTDTLVLTLPACDSIYIEYWGTGMRGLKITNDHNNSYAWHAVNGMRDRGRVGARFDAKDSIRIYLTGTKMEVTTPLNNNEKVNINRIKIYAGIEESDIPEFDGTIAGWTFEYHPKASGTVDLTSHVTGVEGFESAKYDLYASDLGVVRGKLTASKGFSLGYDGSQYATRIQGMQANQSVDFTQDSQHKDYFQLDVPTTGYQDMELQFNFSLLSSATSVVVVTRVAGQTAWTVAGKFEQTGDKTAVSVPLSGMDNAATTQIRIMPDNGTYGNGGELMISALRLMGYDDYYKVNEGALKIAYINNATDRIHILARATTADSLDVKLLPALLKNADLDVDVLHQQLWQDITAENIQSKLSDYDLVILSAFVPANSSIAAACQALIGQKPLLNLNADVYASGAWNWSPVQTSQAVQLASNSHFTFHPVFSGVKLTDLITGQLFTDAPEATLTTAGFSAAQYNGQEGYMIATPANANGMVSIHELNGTPAAKYMLVALPVAGQPYLNDLALQIVNNAIRYVSSANVFVEPQFTMVAGGALVENLSELQGALVYDYAALNLQQIVIEMKPSTDASGAYDLPAEGLTIDASLNNLVFRASQGKDVVLSGQFKGKTAMKFNDLMFDNLILTHDKAGKFISLAANDTVAGTLTIQNCRLGQEADAAATLVEVNGGAQLKQLSVNNNMFGQKAATQLCKVADGTVAMESVIVKENRFNGSSLREMIVFGQTAFSNDQLALSVVNNTFFACDAANNNLIGFEKEPRIPVTAQVNNNLMFQSKNSALTAAPYHGLHFYQPAEGLKVQVLNNLLAEPAENVTAFAVWPDTLTIESNTLDAARFGVVFQGEGMEISKASALYTAGVNHTYVGSADCYVDRAQAGVLTVHNVPELKVALQISVPGDTIELAACDEDNGVYLLGASGLVYPQHHGSLLIRNAQDEEPVLFGRISSSNGAKLSSLVFEGLTWRDTTTYTGYNLETYSPFYVNVRDSIMETWTVRHCNFYDLDNQEIFRSNTGCNYAVIKELRFENCYFDNMGGSRPCDGKSMGAHFIQFVNNSSIKYELDNFVFVNNIVSNFHGSQLFNIARQASTSQDSTINITICHNLFYKLGGHAEKNRNFLEFTSNANGFDVNIDINDNIFYQRWSDLYYPVSNLALFMPAKGQQAHVNLLNNYFDGEYYDGDGEDPNPVAQKNKSQNLYVSSGDEKMVNRGTPLFWFDLEIDELFQDESTFFIGNESPLFTAGTNGGYVGPRVCYGVIDAIRSNAVADSREGLQVAVRESQLLLRTDETAVVNIYNVFGQTVRSLRLEAGEHSVEGLVPGLYLITDGKKAAKVLF